MKYLLHIGLTTGETLEFEFSSEEARAERGGHIMDFPGRNTVLEDVNTKRVLCLRNSAVVYVREFNRDESGHVTTAGRVIND